MSNMDTTQTSGDQTCERVMDFHWADNAVQDYFNNKMPEEKAALEQQARAKNKDFAGFTYDEYLAEREAIAKSPLLTAHLESLKFLGLELEVSIQNAADMRAMRVRMENNTKKDPGETKKMLWQVAELVDNLQAFGGADNEAEAYRNFKKANALHQEIEYRAGYPISGKGQMGAGKTLLYGIQGKLLPQSDIAYSQRAVRMLNSHYRKFQVPGMNPQDPLLIESVTSGNYEAEMAKLTEHLLTRKAEYIQQKGSSHVNGMDVSHIDTMSPPEVHENGLDETPYLTPRTYINPQLLNVVTPEQLPVEKLLWQVAEHASLEGDTNTLRDRRGEVLRLQTELEDEHGTQYQSADYVNLVLELLDEKIGKSASGTGKIPSAEREKDIAEVEAITSNLLFRKSGYDSRMQKLNEGRGSGRNLS